MKKKAITMKVILTILVVLMTMSGCKGNNSATVESTENANATEAVAATKSTEPVVLAPGTAIDIFEEPEFENRSQETKPTEPAAEETQPADEETEESDSEEEDAFPDVTEEKAPEATEETKPQEQSQEKELTEYERYLNMSGDEQMDLISSFDSVEAFFEWLNNAKAEYDAANPGIEIGDGAIDLEEITGK